MLSFLFLLQFITAMPVPGGADAIAQSAAHILPHAAPNMNNINAPKHFINHYMDYVGGGLSTATQYAKDGLVSTTQRTAGAIGSGAIFVKDAVLGTPKYLYDSAANGLYAVKATSGQIMTAAAARSKALTDAIGTQFGHATALAGSGTRKAIDTAIYAKDGLVSSTKLTANAIGSGVVVVKDTALATPRFLYDSGAATANYAKDSVVAVPRHIYNAASKHVSDGWSVVKATNEQMFAAAAARSKALKDAIGTQYGHATALAGATTKKALDTVIYAKNGLVSGTKSTANAIGSVAVAGKNAVFATPRYLYDGAASKISYGYDAVKSAGTSMKNGAKERGKALYNRFTGAQVPAVVPEAVPAGDQTGEIAARRAKLAVGVVGKLGLGAVLGGGATYVVTDRASKKERIPKSSKGLPASTSVVPADTLPKVPEAVLPKIAQTGATSAAVPATMPNKP